VLPKPKRSNIPAGRRPPPAASPVGGGRAHSAGAKSVVTFTALSEAQWQAIRSTPDDWLVGTDWRGVIEQVGRQFSEARAERQAWLKKFRGKEPAGEKKRVDRALKLTRQLQKAWADSSLDDTDLPDPGLRLRQQRAEQWLYHYDIWVTPFAGNNDPMRNQLDWTLMSIWVEAGGKLSYSRKKEKRPPGRRAHTGRGAAARDDRQDHADAERPNTPYAPLVNFLTRTLEAILGRTYGPSNIAKIISRHRPEIANARGMRRRRRGGRFA
jgi:hypothetical protein